MEEQGNPEMVALVLRDIINLALQGRYFFGEGSSDWDALLEKVSGERDVVLKYGEGVERLLGEYVLGKLPDFSGMSPLLTRLCEAVSDIKEKSRTGESCEDDWSRLWTTFSSLETLFGKTFLIPRARLVLENTEAPRHHPKKRSQAGGKGRVTARTMHRVSGVREWPYEYGM